MPLFSHTLLMLTQIFFFFLYIFFMQLFFFYILLKKMYVLKLRGVGGGWGGGWLIHQASQPAGLLLCSIPHLINIHTVVYRQMFFRKKKVFLAVSPQIHLKPFLGLWRCVTSGIYRGVKRLQRELAVYVLQSHTSDAWRQAMAAQYFESSVLHF